MASPHTFASASSLPFSTSTVLSWLGTPIASTTETDAPPRTPPTSKFSWTESSPSESLRSGSGCSPRVNIGSPYSKVASLPQGQSSSKYSYTPSPRSVKLQSEQFQSWTFGAAGVSAEVPVTPTRAVSLPRSQDILVSPKTKVPTYHPTSVVAVPRAPVTGIDILESHFEFDDDDSENEQEHEHRLSLLSQPRILSMVNNATSGIPLLRRTKGTTKNAADQGVGATEGESEPSLFTRRPWKRTASSSSTSSSSTSPPQRAHKRNASSASIAFLRRGGAGGGGTTPELSFSSSASAASDSVESLCSMLGKCAPTPTPAAATPVVVGEIDVKMDESTRTTIAPWLAHETDHFATHAAVKQVARGHQRQVSEPHYGAATAVTKTISRPVLPYDPARRPRLTTHQRHHSHHGKPLPRRPDPLSPSSSSALQKAIAAAKSLSDGPGVTMPLRIPGKVL